MDLERKKQARRRLLHRVYEITGGHPRRLVNLVEVGSQLGFSQEITRQEGNYLISEELLKRRAVGSKMQVSITHDGIKEVEESLSRAAAKPRQASERRMRYDAFISYSSKDLLAAERVATYLKDRSIEVWFDKWNLEPGALWSNVLEEALHVSRAIILIIGPSGLGQWQNVEIRAGLELAINSGRVLIPVLTPGASLDTVPTFLKQYNFLDLRDQKESSFERLIRNLQALAESDVPSRTPPRVFLCHAKEDAERIEGLYFSLRDRGLDPWYDKEKLTVGDDWKQEILRAIEQSDFFAIFISRVSSSKTGFIQKEIRTAVREYQKRPEGVAYLLPIRLEDCDVPRTKLDSNRELTDLHWADLFDDDERAIDKLTRDILRQWERRRETGRISSE